MIPLDPYVLRFAPGDNDRASARRLMKALMAGETARFEGRAPLGALNLGDLSPAFNKILQNVCAALVDGDGISVIILDDREPIPVRDTAEILGYDHTHVTRLLKSGALAAHPHRAGRKRLVPASAIADRLQQGQPHARKQGSRSGMVK